VLLPSVVRDGYVGDEEIILVSNMNAVIQSLLIQLSNNAPFEQDDFGDEEYTPRSPEELHVYMI